MFRKSYVHHQDGYIIHAALYGAFSMRLCKQSTRMDGIKKRRVLFRDVRQPKMAVGQAWMA
jgi:hypothetical protein